MKFSTFLRTALLSTIVVTGLSAQSFSTVTRDPHTGNVIVTSKRVSAGGGLLTSLHATAVYSKRKGYGIFVEHLSTGVGWIFFREAWSFGKQLKYDVAQEQVLGCASGCSVVESGAIRLSEQDFKAAAKRGLEFKLIGKNGSVVGKM